MEINKLTIIYILYEKNYLKSYYNKINSHESNQIEFKKVEYIIDAWQP